jgi:hypothetical protein
MAVFQAARSSRVETNRAVSASVALARIKATSPNAVIRQMIEPLWLAISQMRPSSQILPRVAKAIPTTHCRSKTQYERMTLIAVTIAVESRPTTVRTTGAAKARPPKVRRASSGSATRAAVRIASTTGMWVARGAKNPKCAGIRLPITFDGSLPNVLHGSSPKSGPTGLERRDQQCLPQKPGGLQSQEVHTGGMQQRPSIEATRSHRTSRAHPAYG